MLAAQLTLSDFAVFAAVEATEYVDDLFRLDSAYGTVYRSIYLQSVPNVMIVPSARPRLQLRWLRSLS